MPTSLRIPLAVALVASSLAVAAPVRAEVAAVPVPARVAAAQADLRERLGDEGVLTADPRTGTPSVVARTDGFLTPVTGDGPATAVLDYVRAHPDVFRLDAGDLDALDLSDRYTTPDGVTHLSWEQSYRGVPAIDSGLEADVAPGGRVVDVAGAPRADLAVDSTTPLVSRTAAEATVGDAVGEPAGSSELVIYEGDRGPRLGWRVHAGSIDAVVDARTGAVVRRVDRADDVVDATVYPNYPGAPSGGTATTVDLAPWLTSSTKLLGPNVHAIVDPTDSVTSSVTSIRNQDEVTPGNYPRTPVADATANCPSAGCSWNHTNVATWSTNASFEATDLFYLVNVFHDHLLAAPIGFDAASGNFEGNDAILAQAVDGATTGKLNNANFYTPPNGTPGKMQMYLFSTGVGGSVSGASDASVVFHEYTHGLSNRLITGPGGWGALTSKQPGAMGEAWSDWYAMDYLVEQGLSPDTATPGDVRLGGYVSNPRTEPMDCPVGTATAACPYGGYTYGDFAKIAVNQQGQPIAEVHADGEIWGQTLWDLRQRLIADHGAAGQQTAEQLITNAMRLSPDEPTYLQMRDAILQADTNLGGTDHDAIWQVFAGRGMGYGATTAGPNDIAPFEDFSLPPSAPAPPPDGSTDAPTDVAGHGAKLRGGVNPNGKATSARFELGPTTAYGSATVDLPAGAGKGRTDIAVDVTGLAPGTTYHVRLVATSAAGTSYGADQVFTTTAEPVAPATTAPAAPARKAAKPDIAVFDGAIRITIKAAALPKGAGTAKLVLNGKVIGTVTVTRDGKVRVKLTRSGRRLVTKKGKVSAKLKVRTKAGKTVTAQQAVTLQAGRPRSARR